MIKRKNIITYILLCCLSIFACNGGEKVNEKLIKLKSISDIPKSSINNISKKKIYFGHQSVGFNIINGIKNILKNNIDIVINLKETNNIADFKKPVFAHYVNGINKNPISKVDNFVELIEKGLGNNIDIAFFKLCYVDITSNTDVDKLFNYYKSTLNRLSKKYPKITFIHFTVPLTINQKGPKMFIKNLLGINKDDNINRNIYNMKLINEYPNQEIFDLAGIESTYANGKREVSKMKDRNIYSLLREYTNDGAHLNEMGARIVAEQLLIFLSELKKK